MAGGDDSWSLGLCGYYAILDVKPDAPGAALDRVAGLLDAGPCVLQLRAKGIADRVVVDLARVIAAFCRQRGVPFCLDDRVDLALLVGADLVHLGQDDLPIAAAWRFVEESRGAGAVLPTGISTHDREQALAAVAAGADYIGFGPVFPTTSKTRPDPVVGLTALADIVRAVSVPVVAIGGITVENVASVAATGAAAAAVIGAVEKAVDPTAAGKAIGKAWGQNRLGRASARFTRRG